MIKVDVLSIYYLYDEWQHLRFDGWSLQVHSLLAWLSIFGPAPIWLRLWSVKVFWNLLEPLLLSLIWKEISARLAIFDRRLGNSGRKACKLWNPMSGTCLHWFLHAFAAHDSTVDLDSVDLPMPGVLRACFGWACCSGILLLDSWAVLRTPQQFIDSGLLSSESL